MNDQGSIGICLGASTVSAVVLDASRNITKTLRKNHEGSPEKVFRRVIAEVQPDRRPVLITGRKFRHFVNLPAVSETEATERAYAYISGRENHSFDAVVSVGGETFIAYLLDHAGRVANMSTGNKCASGTGEFFLQQIRRMGLDADEAVQTAKNGSAYHVSGRCSVFCKSDCTHALNKGESIGDVTAGLCKMIAGKVVDLLAKTPGKNVLLVGGTAKNEVVVDYIKREIPSVTIPKEAPYFEALGAALAAFDHGKPVPVDLYRKKQSSFRFLKPLKAYEHLVTFTDSPHGEIRQGGEYILGLDVGSTTTKAVLLDVRDDSTCCSVYLRTNGNPVKASRACYRDLQSQIFAPTGRFPFTRFR